MTDPVVELRQVSKTYSVRGRSITAVDCCDLQLRPGTVTSLVGESGSGKTTIGRLLTGLTDASSGELRYGAVPLRAMTRVERRAALLRVQLIHQDPYASLNPGLRVGSALAAPVRRHQDHLTAVGLRARVHELLEAVELAPTANFVGKFPHELSGGQRQRVAIARALSVDPSVLVADEAVSMIDVSLRASILAMLRRLCDERGLAVLFITHDVAVARQFARADDVAVMYLGRIVERGPAARVVDDPRHPYTAALVTAADHAGPWTPSAQQVANSPVPSLLARPAGCSFHPRCPDCRPGWCDRSVPTLTPVAPGRDVACLPAAQDPAWRPSDGLGPTARPAQDLAPTTDAFANQQQREKT